MEKLSLLIIKRVLTHVDMCKQLVMKSKHDLPPCQTHLAAQGLTLSRTVT